jgi:hypothetical protein
MFSAQFQDKFISNIFEYKQQGCFIDIGSADAILCNNTYLLESEYDWNGICIEFDSKYNKSYESRKCNFLNQDATDISYDELFREYNIPYIIDYLSLDIDELSYKVLNILPFDKYKFKVITIEHDYYLHGDKYRNEQRKILNNNGYMLLCEDVLVEQSGSNPPKTTFEPFEDWWIKPEFFSENMINKIKCTGEYPSDIILKF